MREHILVSGRTHSSEPTQEGHACLIHRLVNFPQSTPAAHPARQSHTSRDQGLDLISIESLISLSTNLSSSVIDSNKLNSLK